MSELIPFGYRETVHAMEQLGGSVRIRRTAKRIVVEVHRERREPLRAEFRQTRLSEKVEGWLARFALPRLQWEREQPTPGVAQLTIDFSADARRLNQAWRRSLPVPGQAPKPLISTGQLRRTLPIREYPSGVHVGLTRPSVRRDA